MSTQRWQGWREGGDPVLCHHHPLGQVFLGKPTKHNPLVEVGMGAPWGDATCCTGESEPGAGSQTACPHGCSVAVPAAPPWHEAPGSHSIPAPSVRAGAAKFCPKVPLRPGLVTPPAVEQEISHATQGWICPCHPQPCSISFELPPPGDPVMAMLMDQVRVFCTLLLLLFLFLSLACTQTLPTALGEQQSTLWLCRATHRGQVGGLGVAVPMGGPMPWVVP